MIKLPIDEILPAIALSLDKSTSFILKASPGSGKTTRLPPLISKKFPGQIIVLEPRRLAAKMSARRIAEEQGLTLGKEIGYSFRYESVLSDETKILFMTEGTFLRKLEYNPELKGISAIVIDEFHERHLETDVILSLVAGLIKMRKDLKLFIMSATIETKPLCDYLTDAVVFDLDLPPHPLEIIYLENVPSILNQSLEKKVYLSLKQCWERSGDILVFLSGMGEIKKVMENLGEFSSHAMILHGDLNPEEQLAVVTPNSKRKIILSTNIAESSVTIPGVRIVIDGGTHRESSFSPWSGLKHLLDKKISQSSAVQRAGRAAREDKGSCYRLYSKMDFDSRPFENSPEIERSDLAEILLYIKSLPFTVDWFHSPPKEYLQDAFDSLHSIGALENDLLTEIGKKMLRYHLPPRISRTLVAAENSTLETKKQLLAHLAAWVEPFDQKKFSKRFSFFLDHSGTEIKDLSYYYLMGMWEQTVQFKKDLEKGLTLKGIQLKKKEPIVSEFVLALEINHRQEMESFIEIEPEWFYDISPFPLTEEQTLFFDEKRKRIVISEAVQLGVLKVSEEAVTTSFDKLSPSIQEKILVLSEKRVERFISSLKDNPRLERILYIQSELKLGPVNLKEVIDQFYSESWVLDEDKFVDFYLTEYESYLQSQSDSFLDESYPIELRLSNKKVLKIHYSQGETPFLMSMIQDFYGLKTTPILKNGQKLSLKLVGPHKRPVQVTNDLPRFWDKTYPEMLKEFNREYPRHYWPDKPSEARPFITRRLFEASKPT